MIRSTTENPALAAAGAWLDRFSDALESGDIDAACRLFSGDGCYWRDLLCFTWNIITLEGRNAVADMLRACLDGTEPARWQVVDATCVNDGPVEAWLTFETRHARGEGHLRLRGTTCWTLLTAMTELKGHEEKRGRNRILGTEHKASRDRKTWAEERARTEQELGTTVQPDCLIIGGGQGGIMLGARLRRLGVSTLIVEKNARAGDSWRRRYKSLVLHDPVWYDHLPYLPFPDDWPVFTPKDKMGDWLEMYTKVMELNYWSATECRSVSRDDESAVWSVGVTREGQEIELRPKYLVFATGAYGDPRMAPLPGAGDFKGEMIHTSRYREGAAYSNRKCVVIGSGSSAHDVCVDLWEAGADVTMVQRSPSIVVRSNTLMEVAFAPLYSEEAVENGISTDRADLLFASMPLRLMADFQRPLYEEIVRKDEAFYDRLSQCGFLWNMGDDDSGLMMKALRTASGYYIDVGASELISNGDIKLKAGREISRLSGDRMHFDDGSSIAADVVIHATGYGSMEGTVSRLISPAMADKIGPFWGYGSGFPGDPGPWEGELRNMWKPTLQEGLWFHGGNLHLSRFYSRFVALQIKARLATIPTPVYASSR